MPLNMSPLHGFDGSFLAQPRAILPPMVAWNLLLLFPIHATTFVEWV
jgi:hypothetical protein